MPLSSASPVPPSPAVATTQLPVDTTQARELLLPVWLPGAALPNTSVQSLLLLCPLVQLLNSLPSKPVVSLHSLFSVSGGVSTAVQPVTLNQAVCGLTGGETQLLPAEAGASSCSLQTLESSATTLLCAPTSVASPSPAAAAPSRSGLALVFRLSNATTVCGVQAIADASAATNQSLVTTTTAVDAASLSALVFANLQRAAGGTAAAASPGSAAASASANTAALAALNAKLNTSLRALNTSFSTLATAPVSTIVAPPCLDVTLDQLVGQLSRLPLAPSPTTAPAVGEASASQGSSSVGAAIAGAVAGVLLLGLVALARRRRRKRAATAKQLQRLAAGTRQQGLGSGKDKADDEVDELAEAELVEGGVVVGKGNPLAVSASAGSGAAAALKSGTAVVRGSGGGTLGEVSAANSVSHLSSGKVAAKSAAEAAAASVAGATAITPRLLQGDEAFRLAPGGQGTLRSAVEPTTLSMRLVNKKPGDGAASSSGQGAAAALVDARMRSRPTDDIGVSKLAGRSKAAQSQRMLQQRVVPLKPGELLESKGTPAGADFLSSFGTRHAPAQAEAPVPEEDVIDVSSVLGFDPAAVEVAVSGANPLTAHAGAGAVKASPARRIMSRRVGIQEREGAATAARGMAVPTSATKNAIALQVLSGAPAPASTAATISADELSGMNPLLRHATSDRDLAGGVSGAHGLGISRVPRAQLSASRRLLRDADVAAVQAGMSREEFLRTQRRKKLTYGQQLLNKNAEANDTEELHKAVAISADELSQFINPLNAAPDPSEPAPAAAAAGALTSHPVAKRPSPAVAALLPELVTVPSAVQRQLRAASTRMLVNPLMAGAGASAGSAAVAMAPTVVRRPAALLTPALGVAAAPAPAAAAAAAPSSRRGSLSGQINAFISAINPMRAGAAAAPKPALVTTAVTMNEDGGVVVQATVEGKASMADYLARRKAAAGKGSSGSRTLDASASAAAK